jgi:hypothetical protein
MDAQSLRNVLGILRLVKDQKNTSTLEIIKQWAGKGASEDILLKVAGYAIEQVRLAQQVIGSSQLTEEAKAGVNGTLVGMTNAFTLGNLPSPFNQHVQNVPASISNFVILLSASGLSETEEVPADITELINEIAETITLFDDPAIDPAVRDVAKRHLQILSTLLQHIPIFGLEAALTSYFELMMKVRRTDSGSNAASHTKTEPIWSKMKTWGSRLDAADKIINSAVKLGEKAEKAIGLLDYIPG